MSIPLWGGFSTKRGGTLGFWVSIQGLGDVREDEGHKRIRALALGTAVVLRGSFDCNFYLDSKSR